MENKESFLQEALSLCQSGQFKEAKKIYLQLLELVPDNTRALSNLGSIALQSGNLEESIKFFSKSLQLDANQPIAYYNYGMALQKAEKYKEALSAYNCATELKSDFAQVYLNRGITYYELKYYDDALANYEHAIQCKPDYAEAYSNRGVTYNALKRYDDALADYDYAIQLKPDYAEAYSNRGNTYSELKRDDDALVSYNYAIQIKPDYAEAYSNRGATFVELKRYDDALASYDHAIQLKPEIDYLLGNLIHTKMHLCDWDKFHTLINQLTESIVKHEIATAPFITLALIDNPELQKQSAEIYLNDKHPISNVLPKVSLYPKHQKIRIGYFSADFHNHATMHLMAEFFESHDKDKFELIAFSFGPDQQDEWRQKAISSFDQFIDVRTKSDIEVASIARELAIDIAVDLKGFTQDARVSIFAHRAAPIQVNYLGYPGTMGAQYIDYIIADPILIAADKRQYYSEKIAYLPNSYQVNVKERLISDKAISRKDVGLPENDFVFCSFNNNYKITPDIFDRWMRILQSVEGSVLWLLKSNDTTIVNLKKEAEFRGVDSSRLVFASFLPIEEHLKRIQLADLFLDTLPYNAHTTASDALRVGLPVITQIGESFVSRVVASLLNTVGLPELITATPKAYESLAIELATNPEQLEKIKTKLVGNLSTSPLYNTKLFAHHIELAYQDMYKRYQDKLTPDHIYVL